jgi:hypothetical protein
MDGGAGHGEDLVLRPGIDPDVTGLDTGPEDHIDRRQQLVAGIRMGDLMGVDHRDQRVRHPVLRRHPLREQSIQRRSAAAGEPLATNSVAPLVSRIT